jgi:hypothetical protein
MIVCVHDARKVEQCVSLFLKDSKYSKHKEVYQGSYTKIKDVVMTCATASAIAARRDGLSIRDPEIVGPENAASALALESLG